MILKVLRLSHFGKFQGKEIELKPGINIIYGKNEVGKTTIHSFIRGMLFGIERQRGGISKEDMYIKYLPWRTKGVYDGSMDIIAGNHTYRLIRNFYKTTKEFKIIDLISGREVTLNYRDIQDIIPGLSESLYRNTVSIEQLRSATGEGLAKEVQKYIANLSVAKTNQVDVEKALQSLITKKKKIKDKLDQINTKDLSSNLEKKINQLSKVDELDDKLLSLEKKEAELREEKERLIEDQVFMRDLNGDQIFEKMRLKFEEYLELKAKCEQLNEEYNKYTKTLNDLLHVENSHKTIYQDIHKINEIHIKRNELDQRMSEFHRQEQIAMTRCRNRCRFRNFLPFICAMVLSLVFAPTTLAISIVMGLLATSIVFYLFRQHEMQHVIQKIEEKETQLDRESLELEAKKREIYLRNNVTDDAELRYKMQMLRQNEQELNDNKEARKEVEAKQIRIYSTKEVLEKELKSYAKDYFDDETLREDLVTDIACEVNRRKVEAEQKLRSLNKEHSEVVISLEKLKWELSNYDVFEEELQKERKQFEEASQDKSKYEKELESIELAISSIEDLSVDIHNSFGDQINSRLSKLIEVISNGMYRVAKLDEALNIRILKEYDYVDFNQLSEGTISEVYLALRLTIADLLAGTKFLPMILDDAFALYDDDRLKSTLLKLSQLTDRQIIIFTCHKREAELANELSIPYHYVEIK